MSRFTGAQDALRPTGLGIWDEERSGLWRHSTNFIFHYRHPAYGFNKCNGNPFFALWHKGSFSWDNSYMMGQDNLTATDSWERPAYGVPGGKQAWYWIKGLVKDGSSVPQAGATVKCFRQSDGLFVGQSISDANGQYQVPTPWIGVAHFVIAYLAGAPDRAGTTVNNLTPTSS